MTDREDLTLSGRGKPRPYVAPVGAGLAPPDASCAPPDASCAPPDASCAPPDASSALPAHMGTRLPRAFFARPTLEVAPELLGLWLVHDGPDGRREGRIVEVEAYCGVEDLACHAAKGRTARTSVMFGPAGVSYVYLIYGMHNCFNVVTDADGIAGAVLVRALEPGAGVTLGTHGPGRLGRALGIDRSHNGLDLTENTQGPLWLERRADSAAGPDEEIANSPRINVDYAGEWAALPWRFYLPGSPHVSVKPRRPRP